MAQDTTISVAESSDGSTWTQLTDANVTSITFQNRSEYDLYVKVTASASAPTDFTGAIKYRPGEGELNTALSELSPGISGTRVYATCRHATIEVAVSHA